MRPPARPPVSFGAESSADAKRNRRVTVAGVASLVPASGARRPRRRRREIRGRVRARRRGNVGTSASPAAVRGDGVRAPAPPLRLQGVLFGVFRRGVGGDDARGDDAPGPLGVRRDGPGVQPALVPLARPHARVSRDGAPGLDRIRRVERVGDDPGDGVVSGVAGVIQRPVASASSRWVPRTRWRRRRRRPIARRRCRFPPRVARASRPALGRPSGRHLVRVRLVRLGSHGRGRVSPRVGLPAARGARRDGVQTIRRPPRPGAFRARVAADRSDDPRDDQSRRSEWMRRLESARRESVGPDPYPEEATRAAEGRRRARMLERHAARPNAPPAKTLVDPGEFSPKLRKLRKKVRCRRQRAGWPPLREPARFLLVVSQLTPRFPNLRTLELGTPSCSRRTHPRRHRRQRSLLLVARLAPNLVTLRVAGASVTDEVCTRRFTVSARGVPPDAPRRTAPGVLRGRRVNRTGRRHAPTRRCPRLETLDAAPCRGPERGTRRAGREGRAGRVESARTWTNVRRGGAWRTNIRKARMRGGDTRTGARRDGLR